MGDVLAYPTTRKRGFMRLINSRDDLTNVAKLRDHPDFSEAKYERGELPPIQFSPGGLPLPPLGADRIRLSRHQATKAWRALANALERATIDLERAAEDNGDIDGALATWRKVAKEALYTDQKKIAHLRSKLGLIAALAGQRFSHGGTTPPGLGRGERALRAVDHILFCLIY